MKYTAALIILSLLAGSCSKKHQPQTAVNTTISSETKPAEKKATVRRILRTPVPKVITVDDRGAQKSVDGRLYYDLEGKRYWRNYDDGRYYLFNKSMYNNPAFKPH